MDCVRAWAVSAVRAGTAALVSRAASANESCLCVRVERSETLVHLAAAKRGMAPAADHGPTTMANLLLLSIILLLASNPGAECALVNRHCHKTWDKGGPVTHQMW